ncbi:MAG: DUF262 domain-containing protein [Acidobacteriota bacterium]|nr:DUF262 domain-containing protein [Acidobacteriota bacterium]
MMEVSKVTPSKLFRKTVRYEVPAFQRRYVWEQEKQWEPLWEDVSEKAELVLAAAQQSSDSDESENPHFLGAIVLQQLPTRSDEFEARLVVDGQQRLTTLQLLLDAIQETFVSRRIERPARRLSRLVLNDEDDLDGDHTKVFKVWPTLNDQAAFRHAMSNELSDEGYVESSIVAAHRFFKEQTATWLDAKVRDGASELGAAEALERAVTHRLEIVAIDLMESDDPHTIFETLNARGTPLLQSEMIKNRIMYDEFDEFTRYASKKPINDVVDDLGRVSETYRDLENRLGPDARTFLYRRDTMRVGVLTPVLLWLASSSPPGEQLRKALGALESYLVRRMACRYAARAYSTFFIELLRELKAGGSDQVGDTLVEHLAAQETQATLWPGDDELREAFRTEPFYWSLSRGRLRLLLEGIEEGLRTTKTEPDPVSRNLTIEHLMPQNWTEHWRLPEAAGDTVAATRHRDRVIHTIGNLTLLTQPLNSAVSNGPWQDKREALDCHSVLFLNKHLVDAPVWNEATIEDRSQRLCEVAARVWPHADDFS